MSDPTHATGTPGTTAASSNGTAADADSLAYPISPEYVKSWTPVRAISELIANALDEDPDAAASWADGVLTIADNGPGIPEEGLILGMSSKTDEQIGQFGEGKKLACLVLARSPEIGAVRCETVSYGFVPTVERRKLLGGLIPSRTQQGSEVLVYHFHPNTRTGGTVFTIECSRELAREAIGRFRALAEPGYQPPASPGVCVRDGEPGRVWIGGVLVTRMPSLLASYDLSLDHKALQNRDRTVVEAAALRTAVRDILASSDDPSLIGMFARHVLSGGKLREQEQFFTEVRLPRPRAAWRTWGRAHLPEQTYYTIPGGEEAALDLKDNGYTELITPGLAGHQQAAVMGLLGVEMARASQQRHYARNRNRTSWVTLKALTAVERDSLREGCELVRRAIGPFALDRVKVYDHSDESPCAEGFYRPLTGDVAIHRDALTDRHRTLLVLLHEAAHRVAHRGGGHWIPVQDFYDRSRGFEQMLSDFAARLLGQLADGNGLPPLDTESVSADGQHGTSKATTSGRRGRHWRADDPSVPAVRRELAHLLLDQLPQALNAGGFRDAKDLVASTAVYPGYWRVLTNPRPVGYRPIRGDQAGDYDNVALLAEAAGLRPPVVWLGYHLCEGPLRGRRRETWGRPGPWTPKTRADIARVCADLTALGGPYAEQVPALKALADGTTAAPLDDDTWHQPARVLLAAERRRLNLSTT
ncbi:ATP-binding protein [Micromonospora sp. WMMD710]|uniref:ATP-binding protein n=1 Tax=Micromonospora sp. WMMD710 TaxID=3016085 RepID=UPI0024171BBC|nr:ATP-binding protein [Micromonospora sp. WMMD710]MDG4760357.1 ATP-binding protein [Micromonospora sp. WMMD710]